MRRASSLRALRPRWGLLAVAALAAAFAWPAQGPGANQNAHYALVRALADGTPRIDRTRHEVGYVGTADVSHYRGHYYAAKAPGLAFATLPVYLALEAAHSSTVRPEPDPTRALWFLGLFGAVLPAALLLLLVRRLADRLEPGFGTAAAVTLGVGTLVLPFATLFFSHALSALLGFAAFAVLWGEREGRPRPALVAGAGLVAGLAITTEYPNALLALILGVYALFRSPRLQRGLAYAAGVAVGVAPLLVYNWWAFRSIAYVPYADIIGGQNETGLYGEESPGFGRAVVLLFSQIGLLRLSPVLVMGAVGTILLHRRGRRAEALVVSGVTLAFFLFNAAYWGGLGGGTPGPRYLIPILPFLALPLGLAYRARPVTTALLAAASVTFLVAVTLTHPISAPDDRWFSRFAEGAFPTNVTLVIGEPDRLQSGWLSVVPFLVLALAAVAAAVRATPRLPVSRADLFSAAVSLAAWGVVAVGAPRLLRARIGPESGALAAAGLVCVAAAAAVGLVLVLRDERSLLGRPGRRVGVARTDEGSRTA